MTSKRDELEETYEPEQLVLSDLINRVLDKGVVISADVMISIADIDLIKLDLRVLLTGVASMKRRTYRDHLLVRPRPKP
jgi:gas vesicle structural protein